jgi:hypothetical protein
MLATTTEIPVVLEKLCIVIIGLPLKICMHFTALLVKDK